MPDLSDSHKRQLVYVAGFLYTLSLHKYLTRDALASGGGIQGYLEAALNFAAFGCCFIAARRAGRRYEPSIALLCFAAYGVLALASSFRSFNLTLSLAEGILFFVVLGIGYLSSQAGMIANLFQSIYWTYTASLVVGIAVGIALPSRFQLWSIDEFTGRTRLSVFSTFPGTMGETAAYLILIAPVVFQRSHWMSRTFLLVMNILAGGKTSTAIILLLLLVEYLLKTRKVRSWRAVALMVGACLTISSIPYIDLVGGAGLDQVFAKHLGAVYGHDVAAEATSLDGRVALWTGSIGLIIGSPFLGYGFGGVRELLTSIAAWSGSSHNGFLELGLAGGMLGLGFFLIGLTVVFWACVRSAPHVRRHTSLVFSFMIAIAFTGITFNFPSYFGFLMLVLILYRSIESNPPGLPSPQAALTSDISM